jgi:transcription initiation factor TFIID TATA-box-binding protein
MDKELPSEPVIVNMTGTVLLEGPMPLELYAEFLPCTEYIPKKFAALKLCCPHPFITCLIFKCGKIVCVGCTSPQMLVDAINWIISQINTFEDEDYMVPKINIENLVACSNVHRELCLRKIQNECPYFIHYEPEIFPGLSISLETEYGTIRSKSYRKNRRRKYRNLYNMYGQDEKNMPEHILQEYKLIEEELIQFKKDKLKHKCIKLVIFQTGKVNIVGCKSFSDIKQAYDFLIYLYENNFFTI